MHSVLFMNARSQHEHNKLRSNSFLFLYHLPTAPINNNNIFTTTPPTLTGWCFFWHSCFQPRHFQLGCHRRNQFCKWLGAVGIVFIVFLFSRLELCALSLLLLLLMSFCIVHAFCIIHGRCQHRQNKLKSDKFLLLFHSPSHPIINNNISATTPPTFTASYV